MIVPRSHRDYASVAATQVIGKPAPYLLDVIFDEYPRLERSRCVMVGDRCAHPTLAIETRR